MPSTWIYIFCGFYYMPGLMKSFLPSGLFNFKVYPVVHDDLMTTLNQNVMR